MKIAILDANTLGEDIDLACLQVIGQVIAYPATAPAEVADRLRDVDCVIVNKVRIGESVLAHANRLKLICVAATGYDNICLTDVKARGIAVCNVVGYSTHSVAQLTLSMVLSLTMHLPAYNRFVESGAYSSNGVANCLVPVYHELAGRTWGIVGCGNIGRRVAAVAEAMGCRVIVCKRKPDPAYTCVDIDTLCREADVITVHTPLTPETENLLSKERIALMKPNAIVVNVARGAVCDETALCQAVSEGRLGGLGIDVYTQEPFPTDSPYSAVMHMDNVCLTPHMAWGAYEARSRCMNEICENIKAFLRGEKRNRLV